MLNLFDFLVLHVTVTVRVVSAGTQALIVGVCPVASSKCIAFISFVSA